MVIAHREGPDGEVASEPRPRIQSAARTVGILLAIARSEEGLTTRQISEQVGIGRQATYHLLHTLVATGVLTRAGSRLVLGLRVGTLAQGFARQLTPSELLAPVVRAVARETGETAYAAGWWSGEIMALAVARGTKPVLAAEVPPGELGDAHARAAGRLLLAFASPDVREGYLERHPLTPATAHTVTDRSRLDAVLAEVREQGYAIDDQEQAEGLACLAVPFDRGHSPFVVALSAPRERLLAGWEWYLTTIRSIIESFGEDPERSGVVWPAG